MKELIRFAEKSEGFENSSRLKLILFAAEAKPATYLHLHINKNLHDKHEFERLLKLKNIKFSIGRAKGYEEIAKIKDNAVVWTLKGIWYDYDLFKDKTHKDLFLKYLGLLRKERGEEADKIAGRLYGYPKCCVKAFINQNKKLNPSGRKFPFITHIPCSVNCGKTKKLNEMYRKAVKKASPRFYREYCARKTALVPIIIDSEKKGLKRNWHEYSVITKKPINGKYFITNLLSGKHYRKGTVLDATVTIQGRHARIKVHKIIGKIKKLHHERKFVLK